MKSFKKSGKSISPGPAGISSRNVRILPSMDKAAPKELCWGVKGEPGQDQKPGYRVCSFVRSFLTTPGGEVPVVNTRLDPRDLLSTLLVRCGIGRDQYRIAPGLYAVGRPGPEEEVLVTANFKLTFDHLRTNLQGISAWILVLDTRGINVWCAAGKGTFSTGELVHRVRISGLGRVVAHRRLILPQLGATGVSAREVKKASGFKVVFGPIRAKDIPEFLEGGQKASPGMRQVTFGMYERFILTPVEISIALKPILIAALVLVVISGIGPGVFSFSGAWTRGLIAVSALITGTLAGAFVTPVLLPHIPFRPFALKGIVVGSIASVLLLLGAAKGVGSMAGILSVFLFSTTVASYLAMNFTGATPFTSPSGVEKEMRQFLPIQAGALLISLGLWIYAAF